MITLTANSINELNLIWKKLRSDFQAIESIHLDPKTTLYRMVISQPELTKMMRSVADKVIDRLDIYEDGAMEGCLSLKQFDHRIEENGSQYPSLEPIAKIWGVISNADRKAVYAYLRAEVGEDVQEAELTQPTE